MNTKEFQRILTYTKCIRLDYHNFAFIRYYLSKVGNWSVLPCVTVYNLFFNFYRRKIDFLVFRMSTRSIKEEPIPRTNHAVVEADWPV